MVEDSDIEIRPLFEIEDFAEVDTDGKVAEHEAKLRQTIATRHAEIQPYLFFGGRCEEALEFYKSALGATVTMLMRFNESPDPVPDGMLQPGFENKIMHAAFQVGSKTLMCSDGCSDTSTFDGFRLALSLPDEAECHSVYDALANGGTADMPLGKTFWSPCYGMVTDKFGVGWMVMVADQITGEQS